MAQAPAWMVQAVVAWIDRTPPAQWQAVAAAEGPLADQLLGQYPPWLRRMGWAALSPGDRARLAGAGPAEWGALLEEVARLRPAAGAVFWRHEAWFHRQLARARDLFLTEAVI